MQFRTRRSLFEFSRREQYPSETVLWIQIYWILDQFGSGSTKVLSMDQIWIRSRIHNTAEKWKQMDRGEKIIKVNGTYIIMSCEGGGGVSSERLGGCPGSVEAGHTPHCFWLGDSANRAIFVYVRDTALPLLALKFSPRRFTLAMNLLKVANVAKRVRNNAEMYFILFATPRIALPVVFNHASIFEQQPEPVKRDGFTVYKTGLKRNWQQ